MINHNSQGMRKFKSRCEDLWLISKQAWYVPFIWSLAWFSYWIFHNIIVFNLQPVEGNPLDYFGASISITALLIAGYVFGKPKKKLAIEKGVGIDAKKNGRFTLPKAFNERKNQDWFLPQKLLQKIRVKKTEQPKMEKKPQEHIKTSEIHEQREMSQEAAKVPTITRALSSQISQPDQCEKYQEISSACLVCPHLLSCKQRQNRTNESKTPCPFA